MTRQQYEKRIEELEKAPNYGGIANVVKNGILVICGLFILLDLLWVGGGYGISVESRHTAFGEPAVLIFLCVWILGGPIVEFLSEGENDELHRIKSEYEKKLKTNDFDLPYGFDTDIFK